MHPLITELLAHIEADNGHPHYYSEEEIMRRRACFLKHSKFPVSVLEEVEKSLAELSPKQREMVALPCDCYFDAADDVYEEYGMTPVDLAVVRSYVVTVPGFLCTELCAHYFDDFDFSAYME